MQDQRGAGQWARRPVGGRCRTGKGLGVQTQPNRFRAKNCQTTRTEAFGARMSGSIIHDFQVEKKRRRKSVSAHGGLGLGSGFSAIRLKHPIRYIQWISAFCLQTLSILAHKGVRLCAVQFGNYEGVQFPLIKTVIAAGASLMGREQRRRM